MWSVSVELAVVRAQVIAPLTECFLPWKLQLDMDRGFWWNNPRRWSTQTKTERRDLRRHLRGWKAVNAVNPRTAVSEGNTWASPTLFVCLGQKRNMNRWTMVKYQLKTYWFCPTKKNTIIVCDHKCPAKKCLGIVYGYPMNMWRVKPNWIWNWCSFEWNRFMPPFFPAIHH